MTKDEVMALRAGDVVYWNDPEGSCSGVYEMSCTPECVGIDEDCFLLLADSGSQIEVMLGELAEVLVITCDANLFWSNDMGWVERESCTLFEHTRFNLPIEKGVRWVSANKTK